MKASELIEKLEDAIHYYGDLEVSCKAEDSFFKPDWVSFNSDDNEISIDCKEAITW
jgi:hypothetical protein